MQKLMNGRSLFEKLFLRILLAVRFKANCSKPDHKVFSSLTGFDLLTSLAHVIYIYYIFVHRDIRVYCFHETYKILAIQFGIRINFLRSSTECGKIELGYIKSPMW